MCLALHTSVPLYLLLCCSRVRVQRAIKSQTQQEDQAWGRSSLRCALRMGDVGERRGPQVPRCLPARDPRERSASPSPGRGPFFTNPEGAFLPSQFAGALATPPECAPGDKPPARSWNPSLRGGFTGQAPAAFIKGEGEKLSLAKFSIAFCSRFLYPQRK